LVLPLSEVRTSIIPNAKFPWAPSDTTDRVVSFPVLYLEPLVLLSLDSLQFSQPYWERHEHLSKKILYPRHFLGRVGRDTFYIEITLEESPLYSIMKIHISFRTFCPNLISMTR
jgi:hypothetical protein